jgi:hypothetical protein
MTSSDKTIDAHAAEGVNGSAPAVCWGEKWGKVPHGFQPIST